MLAYTKINCKLTNVQLNKLKKSVKSNEGATLRLGIKNFIGLGSKSTSLSAGFCVRRPRQYDTICWELDLISGFFVFFPG